MPTDGLAISKINNMLAVVSHTSNVILFYKYIGNGMYNDMPIEVLYSEDLYHPHSIAFHPITNDIVVSNSGGKNNINVFEYISDGIYASVSKQTLQTYNPDTLHLQEGLPGEGGIKGLSFSNDGKLMAACAPDIVDPTEKVLLYKVDWQNKVDA